jgi:hypothetical protein
MKSLRILILLAACGAISTPNMLWAAEPALAKPAPPAATPAPPPAATDAAAKPTDESAAPKSDEDSKDEDGEKVDPKPKPKAAATTADKKGSSPQRFVPSEQVRADFDVSFPIDI